MPRAQIRPSPEPDAPASPGRAFFCTVINPSTAQHVVLAGPYPTHGAALEAVAKARKRAEADPRSCWYAFGTAQAPVDTRTLFGVL